VIVQLYLDANAIIFAHEGPPPLQKAITQRIAWLSSSLGGQVFTSRLARLECRVKPLRQQNQPLLNLYDFVFDQSGLVVVEISSDIVERATELRAAHGFRTADAIHLATALESGAGVFVTGDKQLVRCPGLQFELV
jgi:uncharacterized protein